MLFAFTHRLAGNVKLRDMLYKVHLSFPKENPFLCSSENSYICCERMLKAVYSSDLLKKLRHWTVAGGAARSTGEESVWSKKEAIADSNRHRVNVKLNINRPPIPVITTIRVNNFYSVRFGCMVNQNQLKSSIYPIAVQWK